MFGSSLVSFYRWWHGKLHLPGAGIVLRAAASFLPSLRTYPLAVPNVGTIRADFRDSSAFAWINKLGGEQHQEEGLISFLKKRMVSNSVFWDVGANIGIVTASLLPHFPRATYCLFEPNPALASTLIEFFQASPNVLVFNQALSDRSGDSILKLPKGDSAIATLNEIEGRIGREMPVKLISGDDFVRGNPHLLPTLVKVDVEGHEPKVLAGMKHTISTAMPVLVFEHLFLSDHEATTIIPQDYQIQFIDDETGELAHALDRRKSRNSVLLPPLTRQPQELN